MSAPSPIVASPPIEASTPSASARSDLAEQTRAFADESYQAVASAYLAFRKEYYHETQPSLDTPPPAHAEIRKSELALLVESTLRLVPQAVKSVPLVGGFVRHLQRVADLHSISEDERTALHNLTTGFLRGVRGGIQPWYVEWLLSSARNLSQIRDLDYYLDFPFDGLLYRDPDALTALESAVRNSDATALRGEIERMATQLIHVLGDPVGSQPLLAFTGPDGEHRKLLFNLETTAGLALLAYLIAAEARLLLRPGQTPAFRSALAPLPRQTRAQAADE